MYDNNCLYNCNCLKQMERIYFFSTWTNSSQNFSIFWLFDTFKYKYIAMFTL